MALTVTGFSTSALSYKLAHEDNASDSASTDIFGGPGTLHSINFNNNQASNNAYLKLKITSGTVTVGTTQPDLLFELPAGGASDVQIAFPAGLSFSQLSFWVTDAAPYDDTGDPGTVLLTFLCS